MFIRLCLVIVAGLGLALAIPTRADNPKLAIKVEKATAAEAAAALSKAAGVRVRLFFQPEAPNAKPAEEPPEYRERSDFDWTGVTFARALRQLCEKYGLRPWRQPGGDYLLHQSGRGGGPAPKLVGLYERNGVRVHATGVQFYENRSVSFVEGQADWGHAQLSLQLAAQLGDGEGDTVAGVENVTGKDDLGNVVAADPNRGVYHGSGSQYPDEWQGGVSLSLPHPKAKKLQWLEGDLMVYRSIRPLRVELPLPLSEKRVRKDVGDVAILVSEYRPAEKAEADDLEADFPGAHLFGRGARGRGPSVRVRVAVPAAARLALRNAGQSWGFPPHCIGASGRSYPAQQLGGSSSSDGLVMVYDMTWAFPMDEPPAKLVWELVERSDPQKILTFRMNDIPLPGAAPFVAGGRVSPPPPLVRRPAGADRPFFEAGGGKIASRVQLGDQPAPEGTLSLGLSTKNGAEWGGVRWIEADVDKEGLATLEDVKPGAYRVLRRYRPREGAQPRGRWLNAEVQVEVAAGKEGTLPPLRWTADLEEPAPAKPAAGPRPAAARANTRPRR